MSLRDDVREIAAILGDAMPTDMVPEPLWDEVPCRVCGCTDSRACEGGCYWIEDDLCSSCGGPP